VFAYIYPPRSFINKLVSSFAHEFVEIPHQYEQLVLAPLPVTKEGVIYIYRNFKNDYTISI